MAGQMKFMRLRLRGSTPAVTRVDISLSFGIAENMELIVVLRASFAGVRVEVLCLRLVGKAHEIARRVRQPGAHAGRRGRISSTKSRIDDSLLGRRAQSGNIPGETE
ncbi:MAG TPA: hypothetical protein VFO86_12575 [Terriglobia bacterium]|nr:hypothetical protein [Terriglobia bacterium]